jgi:methylenetetrahydrofolate reductase (NADPH)
MKPTISFEFFPPKTEQARVNFWEHVGRLAELKPAFVTVTYGAGGSTRDWTIDTAIAVREKTGVPTAAHLTAIGTPRADIRAMAKKLWDNGIRHIVAVRGDMPRDADMLQQLDDMDCYKYAGELVAALKSYHPFEISVGCYPEKHPESSSAQADLDALRHKIDAGADRAITQFFFGNETFFDFAARVRQAGITVPVVPGVLPIASFEKMLSFAAICRAKVPDWLRDRFSGLEEKPDEARAAAVEVLAEQWRGLGAGGARHIHFYTLNRADLITEAARRL